MTFSRIVSTGMAFPRRVVTNHELAQTVDTSDEWIFTRTGIHERRVAGPDETTSDLAAEAGLMALKRAGMDPMDLEVLLVATITGDLPFPATACLTQTKMGAKRAVAFDISAACSGYIYGLSVADAYIRSGMYKNVLVIGSEILTKFLDWNDRGSCVLFGDGAGATLVTASETPGLKYVEIGSDGDFAELIYIPGGGSRVPTTHETVDAGLQYARLDGKEVYKLAVRYAQELTERALEKTGLTVNDIDLLVPHQANQRITDAVQERLGIAKEKVVTNIEYYGNTSGATIPVCLHEAVEQGRLKPGNKVLLVAFGAGFTWGAAVLEW
ncbi:MAG: ketoacyl-ACP synthase III [Candidatus Omnitrophica bacterium]|nr:ketoacyl-ACP synthase III [Candidatus Omnitrophota bacterium]